MAWQTADVIDAITAAAGVPLTELRVDGGASAMDVLCQFQADVLGVTVRRPVATETTVLGAASLAGIAEGVWASPAEAAAAWREDAAFLPAPLPRAHERRADWRRGVDRARNWADPDA
jgi:glycerol kinase